MTETGTTSSIAQAQANISMLPRYISLNPGTLFTSLHANWKCWLSLKMAKRVLFFLSLAYLMSPACTNALTFGNNPANNSSTLLAIFFNFDSLLVVKALVYTKPATINNFE